MVCTDCLFAFFYEPFKVSIALISLVLSVIFFLYVKNGNISQKRKVFFIYAHIFTLVFPFVFYAFNTTCAISGSIFICKNILSIINIIIITSFSSVLLGYLLTPKLLEFGNKSKEVSHHYILEFIGKISAKHSLKKIKVYIIDSAKPFAYSISTIKPYIFTSIGLTELLSKKEIEAVLLHEMGHIKNRTSFLKFSTLLHKLLPLSYFTNFNNELRIEEKRADQFAISEQQTDKYLQSAKRKMLAFEMCKDKADIDN